MKRFLIMLSCVVMILTAAGCGKKPDFPTIPSDTVPEIVLPSPSLPGDGIMHAIITPQITESYVAEDGTRLFYRRYPVFQLLLDNPQAETLIGADLQARIEEFLSESASMEELAQQDYRPNESWYPYFSTVSYTPKRLDDSVLSLYTLYRSQTNEIHPSYNTGSVTYNLKNGQVLTLGDILVENWDIQALVEKICDALSDISENLDSDYKSLIQQRFSRGANESTAWYFTDSSLCFYFAPYDIAPYFMGVITAEIPYSQLEGLLKSEYFPTETPASSGELRVEPYLKDSVERFDFIASMATDTEGSAVLIHATADIYHLSVQVCPNTPSADAPEYTLFTADCLPKNQALKITTDFADPGQALKITYRSGDNVVSADLVFDWENDCYRLIYA